MKCEYSEYTSGYIDNELEVIEKLWFEKHVEECRSCANDLLDFIVVENIVRMAARPRRSDRDDLVLEMLTRLLLGGADRRAASASH